MSGRGRRLSVRRRIIRFVRGQPGASVTRIADAVGVDWTTVDYHLRDLVERQVLTECRSAGRRLVFMFEDRTRAPSETLLTPAARCILEGLREVAPASATDLAEHMERARTGVRRHLIRLEHAGLVHSRPDGLHILFFPVGDEGRSSKEGPPGGARSSGSGGTL